MISLKELAEKETDSCFRLTKHVIDRHAKGENLLFSPLSIHVVLAMTAAGASGSTRAQLLDYLKSARVEQLNSFFSEIVGTVLADGSTLGGPQLSTKNGLWVDQSLTLKPAFRDIVHKFYKAAAENVDFQNQAEAVIKQVNDWCNKETRGLIKEILPPHSLDEETRFVLANAVYFKGKWVLEFDPYYTRDRDFYLLDGTRLRATFMAMPRWYRQCVRAFDGFKVAKLPYKRGKDHRAFSMYIYLPDARDGLPSLMERIYSEPGFIDHHLPHEMEKLDAFRIPKFKIAFEFEASEVMKELGVGDLFLKAGLTEMVDGHDGKDEPLVVAAIRHKAFVEVNEAGSEAAAVTEEDGVMGCGLMRDEPPRMRFEADHPFLFLIREDTTGVVLFVGQLLNPLA